MLKQCLDFLLNLNDEQLGSLKQRVLQLIQRQKSLLASPPAATAPAADGVGGQSEKAEKASKTELTSLAASHLRAADEYIPCFAERLLQNCSESELDLIPKQLEALERLQSPQDRQKEILSLLKVFLELLDPLIEEANSGDADGMQTPLSVQPSQKQVAASKLAGMKSRWEKIAADWHKGGMFDSSKISDILDMVRYELIHHCYLLSRDGEAFSRQRMHKLFESSSPALWLCLSGLSCSSQFMLVTAEALLRCCCKHHCTMCRLLLRLQPYRQLLISTTA
ncbi:hypothetical protein cyc_07673 [Cyclospora cayetanensis]|uniref:Uncharacterized protein n=1 Tax=Cyclospora cayetanensis TaxID=88456 RepID=A0A1D3DA18_9EIME|nr:hypothetical protein cyc_07673 [Cyclospora cayetanensis]